MQINRSIKLSLRFVLPLLLAMAVLALALVFIVDRLMLHWSMNDIDLRSHMIANTLQDPLTDLVRKKDSQGITILLDRVTEDERLLAIGFCDEHDSLQFHSSAFPTDIDCSLARKKSPRGKGIVVNLPSGEIHFMAINMRSPALFGSHMLLIHDMSYVYRRSEATRNYILIFFLILGVVISFITVLVAQMSWHGWMQGVRAILRGEGILRPLARQPADEHMQTLLSDLRGLLRTLDVEKRFADDSTITWSPESLKTLLKRELVGERIIVVSNREPYIHKKTKTGIEVHRPASGLVTAVEPIMRACSGTWIAHGSGNGDHEAVDENDRVQVPPSKPSYSLRRIWLTEEDEAGYYYGFSNEGLWPLCHNAHVRPVFRSEDWDKYVQINQRFADAVIEEAQSDDPVVMIQDYHLALVPSMIHQKLPRATVLMFWHIPWPNPESFGICPWRQEILKGLLGATILGFHTRFHCKNFIETVDRYLETRIEHESYTISRRGHLTRVQSYPISIQWPPGSESMNIPIKETREKILGALNLPVDHKVGLGVDRMDYTKGILERFLAVEKLLELYPETVGNFSLIQIAAPSRSILPHYKYFHDHVSSEAKRINDRFKNAAYPPIILRDVHHDPDTIIQYYRASDVCLVTSLHDGMNLVAKEFIAARDDEQGALVLSMFTGAAMELHESLIVNPYYIEQTADAIHRAITMPEYEQQERMRSMRSLLRDFNVYRWAGRMLLDAARIRQREKLSSRLEEN